MPCRNQNRRLAKQSALEQESKSWQHMKKKMRQSTVTLKSHMQACGLLRKSNHFPLNSDSCLCRRWTITFCHTVSYSTGFPLAVCGCIQLYIQLGPRYKHISYQYYALNNVLLIHKLLSTLGATTIFMVIF